MYKVLLKCAKLCVVVPLREGIVGSCGQACKPGMLTPDFPCRLAMRVLCHLRC